MRLAVCLAIALSATAAGAESLRDALIGNWALMPGSQLATDADNIAAAEAICASPGIGASRGLTLRSEDERFVLEFWDRGDRHEWKFDREVRGARLDDGRIAMQFSVGGTASHELTYWQAEIEGAERNLLEVLGPPVKSGFYLKCP